MASLKSRSPRNDLAYARQGVVKIFRGTNEFNRKVHYHCRTNQRARRGSRIVFARFGKPRLRGRPRRIPSGNYGSSQRTTSPQLQDSQARQQVMLVWWRRSRISTGSRVTSRPWPGKAQVQRAAVCSVASSAGGKVLVPAAFDLCYMVLYSVVCCCSANHVNPNSFSSFKGTEPMELTR